MLPSFYWASCVEGWPQAHCVAKQDFELQILLSPPPECLCQEDQFYAVELYETQGLRYSRQHLTSWAVSPGPNCHAYEIQKQLC